MECRWEENRLVCRRLVNNTYFEAEPPVTTTETGITIETTEKGGLKVYENGAVQGST